MPLLRIKVDVNRTVVGKQLVKEDEAATEEFDEPQEGVNRL